MSQVTDSIEQREQAIVDDFALFDDWMGKYEYLIEMGDNLPLIEKAYKTEDHTIKGCQAQVWFRSELDDGVIHFKADSDAAITKGLIALLVRVLNEQPPEAVASADLAFLDKIGMKEHLSPTRKNGLDAMIKQIRLQAIAYSQLATN